MKVVIPVAGVGTRLRPHTHSVPKVLVRVAGKTILEHILDDIISLNPDEIIFIIGYLGNKIEEFAKERYSNIKMSFIQQEEYNGLGAAIYLSNEKVDPDEDLLIILGDTIIRTDFKKFIKQKNNAIAVKNVEDPRKYGVIEIDNKIITKFIEKPENPPTDMAVVGLYYIKQSSDLLKSLEHIIDNDIKTKGEYQLTDALQYMLDQGNVFEHFSIDKWLDCGNKENLLDTNRVILEETGGTSKVKVKNSVIIEPVFVHSSAVIEDSIIGPNVSIGKNSLIKKCTIEETIIGEDSNIEKMMISNSLIGDHVILFGTSKHLNVGNNSEINFSE